MIVLDTNVLSEMMKPDPSPEVSRWVARHFADELFTTAISQAEILYGVHLLPKGRRRDSLLDAAQSMFEEDLSGRVLPFNDQAAAIFGEIVASRKTIGRPIAVFDG